MAKKEAATEAVLANQTRFKLPPNPRLTNRALDEDRMK